MIFVVEDDRSIRELVLYSLRNSGLECMGFNDGEEFFAELKNCKPELVVLDIMLPKEDGLSILRKIRAMRTIAELPVIMLTAKDTEYDAVVGLDMGADDYIKKPFGVMEFIARVKRLIERTKKSVNAETKLVFKGIEVDIPKHLVGINGKEVVLSLKEFDLLCFLIRSKNIVHSRETLLSQVWGYDYATETRTIDAHIMSLRQKLGDEGKYVQTIRGVGYKIGELE